jgi:hypothetical protein
MKKCLFALILMFALQSQAQVKLCMDSTLFEAYKKKYGIYEHKILIPFYCDPFCTVKYNKNDTVGLCGKFVFVDDNKVVKIKTDFQIPCWLEPRFKNGHCVVAQNNQLVLIDTNGKVVVKTNLNACSKQKNKILPFDENGWAKVYEGHGSFKHYYEVYYIDKNGKRMPHFVNVKVRIRKPNAIVASDPVNPDIGELPYYGKEIDIPDFDLPVSVKKGKYPLPYSEYKELLSKTSHKDNRMLVYFNCGQFQKENMSLEDSGYCGNFVFTDSFLNIRISRGFKLPCGFEPAFSEGLCAVAINNEIVYIDTVGNVKIQTGLKACDSILNKASTFKNGIATLYVGDKSTHGLYTTFAINTKGERVRLLEFDDLDLAELQYQKFKNLTLEECNNCFVGRGKTNGIWFLIEKSGKIRKKLDLK